MKTQQDINNFYDALIYSQVTAQLNGFIMLNINNLFAFELSDKNTATFKTEDELLEEYHSVLERSKEQQQRILEFDPDAHSWGFSPTRTHFIANKVNLGKIPASELSNLGYDETLQLLTSEVFIITNPSGVRTVFAGIDPLDLSSHKPVGGLYEHVKSKGVEKVTMGKAVDLDLLLNYDPTPPIILGSKGIEFLKELFDEAFKKSNQDG